MTFSPQHMEITLDFPEPLASTLGYSSAALPRRLFEALVVDECVRGRLSWGKECFQRERSCKDAGIG